MSSTSTNSTNSSSEGSGHSTTLDVRVIFSESGQTRTFSFASRVVTISQLKQTVERDAADLLSSSSSSENRFFLDLSGRELKIGQQIQDNSTTELIIFSSDSTFKPVPTVAIPQLQVPGLSSFPPLSLPTINVRAQPTAQQLHEYIQTFHALGSQLEFIRNASLQRYHELGQLFARNSRHFDAFRSLVARLHSANGELSDDISSLRRQYDQQKIELDSILPLIETDLDDLRSTLLHSAHVSYEKNRHKLIDTLPPDHTSANLKQWATHAKNNSSPLQKPIEDLLTDYTNKVNLEALKASDQNILAKFDLLQTELSHVKSLLDELDAFTIRHNNFTQQLASSLLSGDPAALTTSLNDCLSHGTVKELLQQPASTAAYEAIQRAHHHGLEFCSTLSEAIAGRLATLSTIKSLSSRKSVHIALLKRATTHFHNVRKVHNFHEAYEAALREIIRRRDFDTQFTSCIQKANDDIRSLYDAELASRSQFGSKYLEFLNLDMFPDIEDLPKYTPMITGDFDRNLPNIGRIDCLDRSWIDIDVSPNSDYQSSHNKQQQQQQQLKRPLSPSETLMSISSSNNSDGSELLLDGSVVSDLLQTPEELVKIFTQNAQVPSKQIEDLQRQIADQQTRISEFNAIVEELTYAKEQLQQQVNQQIAAQISLQQQSAETTSALQAKFDQEVERLSLALTNKSEELRKKEALNVRLIQEDTQKSAARMQLQTKFQQVQTQCEQLRRDILTANEALADARRSASQQAEEFTRQINAKDRELTTVSNSLKSEVKSLAEALSTLSDERERAEQELQQKAALVCDMGANVDTITTELQTLTTECAELTAERDSLVTARTALISERDQIAGDRDSLLAEVDRLSAELLEAHRSVTNLESECTQLTQDRDAQTSEKKRVEARLAECLTEMSHKDDSIAALTEERDQLRDSSNKLVLSTNLERVTSKSELTRLSEDLNRTKQVAESAELKMQRLRTEIAEKDDRIQSAHNQVRALEQSIRVTEEQNALLKTESASRMSAIESLRKEKEQVVRQISSKQSEIDSLKQELQSVDSQLAEYRSNFTQSRTELSATEQRLTQTVDTLSTELANARKRLEETQATIRQLECNNTKVSSDLKKLKSDTVPKSQLDSANADRRAMQDQLNTATTELQAKQEQLARVIRDFNAEQRKQQERVSNAERQCTNAHEQSLRATQSLACCAGGLRRIASSLHLNAHANAMKKIEANSHGTVADASHHVEVIVEEFTRFVEDADDMAMNMRSNNTNLDPTKMTIKLSNFMQGDKILFLPLPGCRSPGEQAFFAVCQDSNAPPAFLCEESLLLRAGTNNNVRQSSYLLGEFYFADTLNADANNPYRLPAGAAYSLIQARLF